MKSGVIIKPKNQRTKRILEQRAPKLIENGKLSMFIYGGHTSDITTGAMKDLYLLKKPSAVLYRRKNLLLPFEDPTSLEFFSEKSDASLFVYGSHNKKRPHNLIIGRLFDHTILDMIEMGITSYKPLSSFKGAKCFTGIKPCLVFGGDLFEKDKDYIRLKSILLGEQISKVNLCGLQCLLSFTAVEGKIYMRVFNIQLKKAGSHVPRVELEEMGPSLDLVLRRTHLADATQYRRACKQPKESKIKKTKNVSSDPFGSTLGKLHMSRQDFTKLQTRKMKGLKRPRGDKSEIVKRLKTDQQSII